MSTPASERIVRFPFPASPPWLTLPEACSVLRIGRTRAYQRAKATGFIDDDRRIPVLRVGGTYRVSALDLKLAARR